MARTRDGGARNYGSIVRKQGDHRAGIVFAELELRHVGMAGGDAALEPPGKLVEIEAAAERAKRRRARMLALVGRRDRMAGRAIFLH